MSEPKKGISVEGIVSSRTKEPYVTLFKDDNQIAQLTMSQARNIAHDILTMCARTEADAMLIKFFGKHEFPDAAAVQLMHDFRVYRFELDQEPVEKLASVPLGDQFDFTKKKVH